MEFPKHDGQIRHSGGPILIGCFAGGNVLSAKDCDVMPGTVAASHCFGPLQTAVSVADRYEQSTHCIDYHRIDRVVVRNSGGLSSGRNKRLDLPMRIGSMRVPSLSVKTPVRMAQYTH